MNNDEQLLCPEHKVPLERKMMVNGLPCPEERSNFILGDEATEVDKTEHVYQCPECSEVYSLNEEGKLEKYNWDLK